jgi:hypothetical protein
VRYLVLLRYGLRRTRLALIVDRAEDGEVSCVEPVEQEQGAGMRWLADGRFWLACGTTERMTQRTPLSGLTQPEVVYSIPGPRLVNGRAPDYSSAMPGATVQICAYAVLEEPDRVALQLLLTPQGQQPYHRETVGDRRIDEGSPALWIVLDRDGDEPPDGVAAAQRVLRWPPPLRGAVRL